MSPPRKIALLGMMTKIPVAGVVWQTLHYMLGFRRLGFEPYYVEAHARAPSMLMASKEDDGAALAAAFIDRVMRRFDLGENWAYQALHVDDRCFGLSHAQLLDLYGRAELIVNLHGGTVPRPEHSRTGRLVYVETDPVQLQIELAQGKADTIEFLEQHCAYFTFAENWGAPDCRLPRTARFDFRPTRQPVCPDLWLPLDDTPTPRFTTVGNWRQMWRDVTFDGRVYTWSKDQQFEPYLELPARTGHEFELALSTCPEGDRSRLSAHGWTATDAAVISGHLDSYRDYIRGSRGEFTVAKEQNVALRSGWFSDRSATYLAAARPVITQETGFSNVLPTGVGLHGFSTPDEAALAVETVCANYQYARRSAREIATECFSSDIVLPGLLDHLGVSAPGVRSRPKALASGLRLTPQSRRPLRLERSALAQIFNAPLPFGPGVEATPEASVVVVSHDNVALTRLCVESVLENTHAPQFELIVVDNGSRDGSRSYLGTLARRFPNIQLVLNAQNVGFPAACNQGLRLARGKLLVLLNNDAIVAPGWLERLAVHATAPSTGIVGPVTNRIGNEAEIDVRYETYDEFLSCAHERAMSYAGEQFEIAMPAMFCLALRREVFERIGPLDESFGLGTLEDDDYAERVRRYGYRAVCAEDVLVHHFGEGSLGRMFASGAYGALLYANRRRFEQKWGRPWQPYGRRLASDYEDLRQRIRRIVDQSLPDRSAVIVASRGDEELVRFAEQEGWHFPQMPSGEYAGHYPSDGAEAVAQLEQLRQKGGGYFLVPKTSLWWLDHYRELRAHLTHQYTELLRDEACVVFALEGSR